MNSRLRECGKAREQEREGEITSGREVLMAVGQMPESTSQYKGGPP